MDMLVAPLRYKALGTLVKAYKPAVPVPFIARLLGFVARARPSKDAGVSDKDGLGSTASGLEVLPGCSAAVFPGRARAQVSISPCLEVSRNIGPLCVLWSNLQHVHAANVRVHAVRYLLGTQEQLRRMSVVSRGSFHFCALQEDVELGEQACVQWLEAHGAVLTTTSAGDSAHALKLTKHSAQPRLSQTVLIAARHNHHTATLRPLDRNGILVCIDLCNAGVWTSELCMTVYCADW